MKFNDFLRNDSTQIFEAGEAPKNIPDEYFVKYDESIATSIKNFVKLIQKHGFKLEELLDEADSPDIIANFTNGLLLLQISIIGDSFTVPKEQRTYDITLELFILEKYQAESKDSDYIVKRKVFFSLTAANEFDESFAKLDNEILKKVKGLVSWYFKMTANFNKIVKLQSVPINPFGKGKEVVAVLGTYNMELETSKIF